MSPYAETPFVSMQFLAFLLGYAVVIGACLCLIYRNDQQGAEALAGQGARPRSRRGDSRPAGSRL